MSSQANEPQRAERPRGAHAAEPSEVSGGGVSDAGAAEVSAAGSLAANEYMADHRPIAEGAVEPGCRKRDPILVARNVTRTYGGINAVDVAHVEIPRHKITALIGPNGAGKTTLFNLLTGFDTPQSGDWQFEGRDLAGVSAYKVARLGMVRTFQLTKIGRAHV